MIFTADCVDQWRFFISADPEDDNASELAIGKESTSRDLDAEDYPAAVESAGPSLRKRKQRPMRHGFIY